MSQNVTELLNDTLCDRDSIYRVVRDLIADCLIKRRKLDVFTLKVITWTSDTSLKETGLALDSMERMMTAEAVAEFFDLYETGAEDYLLALDTLGEWVDLVISSLKSGSGKIVFRTSGSTGEPKKCMHTLHSLIQEAQVLSSLFQGTARIISFVPAHHIYGFLYTVLLPAFTGAVPVVDARFKSPGGAARALSSGDLVIATPTIWSLLLPTLDRCPKGILGASSTEPMPTSLWNQIRSCGLAVTEIYGSSETAGIGARAQPDSPFSLFSHWQRASSSDCLTRTLPDCSMADFELQDHLDWEEGERQFWVNGRRDQAVQVSGYNVFPHTVANSIENLEAVAECAVRFDPALGALKAVLVPATTELVGDALIELVRSHCLAILQTHERPISWHVMDRLPRTDMGKIADWPA